MTNITDATKANAGCLYSYLLDGQGGGRELTWQELTGWNAAQGTVWVHLDRMNPASQEWVRNDSGLDPVVAEALLAEETRPRAFPFRDGVVVILRGVNLNKGFSPEDMVSIRVWIDPHRVITLRYRRLAAAQDLRESVASQTGPGDSAAFLVMLAERLVERMAPVINDLEENTDDCEDQIVEGTNPDLRRRLAELRRQVIGFRRHLAPQRDVMAWLQARPGDWGGIGHEADVREAANHLIRYVEELDAIRERAGVMQEELAGKLAQRTTSIMFLLTILSGVFLPLMFLTGLLGINVGGIPGSQHPWGFAIVCGILAGIVLAQVMVFRRLKWI